MAPRDCSGRGQVPHLRHPRVTILFRTYVIQAPRTRKSMLSEIHFQSSA